MDYVERFSDGDLERIIDEATIYMCACPAQAAVAIRQLRGLYRYQLRCLQEMPATTTAVEAAVHRNIADSAIAAHAELESCLDRVLDLEGWDRTNFRMPDGLRRRRDSLLDGERT